VLGPAGVEALPGLIVLVVLITIVACGLVVVFAEHRRNRNKSLVDREAEAFAEAVTTWDFDAAERSLRWALAVRSHTDPVPEAKPAA
jgi:hypothetical protein